MTPDVDALLVVSFGGPEGPDDVLPFLENVTRGRNVPPERLAEVADNYQVKGGVSPLNGQMRQLVAGLQSHFRNSDDDGGLPVYWGNRNWHPMLADTVQQMADDGVRHALAFATSAYSSYSGCRQYLEDLERARSAVGPDAPLLTKLAPFSDRTEFVDPFVAGVAAAMAERPSATTALLGTAHSLPRSMAQTCDYEDQLRSVLERVANGSGHRGRTELVWQSRSGPPQVPWLEPDIGDLLPHLAADGITHVVVAPIGFLTDHFEVIWDLDTIASAQAADAGLDWCRIPTPGPGPATVDLVTHLVAEARADDGPLPCRATCCPPPQRPA
ncbi:MAG: ferrochelatase [Acidimicrobiales bacterium]